MRDYDGFVESALAALAVGLGFFVHRALHSASNTQSKQQQIRIDTDRHADGRT